MVARALAIAHTSIYDAWAAYDNKAVGTRLGSSLRRPVRQRTAENAAEAVSFAAYRAAVDLFPGSASSVFDPLMRSLGYDAADHSTDATTPTGIGNIAAQAVLDFRHRDGANQFGDERGGGAGVSYSDYTGYVPANDPMDIRVPFDPATVHDPNAWQPLRYVDGGGTVVAPGFVGAQWQHVTTFAVSPGSLRSATGPAKYGSPEYLAQAQALTDLSATLTDEQRMIAEYWADGPRSELPPGHWNLFAQFVSRRDHHGDHEHGLERDVMRSLSAGCVPSAATASIAFSFSDADISNELRVYTRHYNEHRPHRALQLAPPDGVNSTADVNRCATAPVRRREILGGLIHEYRRAA
jgi:hypothetical protein